MTAKKKNQQKAGRKTNYKPEYAEEVFRLCLLGATNEEIATFFETSTTSLQRWISKNPEFRAAIKEGKKSADANVANSLYKKAMKGDTTAQIFWLKNRNPAQWRDKQEVDLSSSDGSMSPGNDMTDEELATRLKDLGIEC